GASRERSCAPGGFPHPPGYADAEGRGQGRTGRAWGEAHLLGGGGIPGVLVGILRRGCGHRGPHRGGVGRRVPQAGRTLGRGPARRDPGGRRGPGAKAVRPFGAGEPHRRQHRAGLRCAGAGL
ncbi:MAG: hypothetical protein AVDCRST_MAG68-4096, partial [uncultured Gemmatimonadetes bacterium]